MDQEPRIFASRALYNASRKTTPIPPLPRLVAGRREPSLGYFPLRTLRKAPERAVAAHLRCTFFPRPGLCLDELACHPLHRAPVRGLADRIDCPRCPFRYLPLEKDLGD